MGNKNILTAVLSVIGIAAIPSITYIYSQGQNNATQVQLVESMTALNKSVVSLTEKTSQLSSDLRSEIVKIDHIKESADKFERKQNAMEQRLNVISESVARLEAKEG